MDFAFALTPGLSLFMLGNAQDLVSGESEISTFYTVTVLTLFGHFPLSILMGIHARRRGASAESAVTLGALVWLLCAVASITLLVVHVSTKLPFFFHSLVIMSLVVGTLVRLLLVLMLPLAYYNYSDASLFFLWWWLLVGLDWPAYAVQWGMLVECVMVFLVAQLVMPEGGGVPNTTRAAIVAAVPIALRFTGLSLVPYLWTAALPLLIACIALAMHSGCAVDVNRVLDWTLGGELDGGSARDADDDHASDALERGGHVRVPARGLKKGD